MTAPTGDPTAAASRHRSRAPFMAMWTSIATSVAVLSVLLARGWGGRAWGIAAGLLAVSCIAVCIWAGVVTERSIREVERLTARLADTRRRRP